MPLMPLPPGPAVHLQPVDAAPSSHTAGPRHPPPHPHPLRSHRSTEDVMGQEVDRPAPPRIPIGGGGGGAAPSRPQRNLHRRSRAIHSLAELHIIDLYQSPDQRSLHRCSTDSLGSLAGSHKIVVESPPLRPTLSLGNLSMRSCDSTAAMLEDGSAPRFDEKEVATLRPPVPRASPWKLYACLVCVYLVQCTCDYGATALVTALPNIANDLSLDAIWASWLPGSYLLAAALTQPLFSRLSTTIGHKTILLSGIVLLMAGSVVSSAADSPIYLLIGRSVEGVGCGACLASTPPIIRHLFAAMDINGGTRRHLALPLSWIGVAVGPIIGAGLAQVSSWRSIFYLQACLCASCLVVLLSFLHLPVTTSGSVIQRLRRVDFLGWVLIAGSVAPTAVALSAGGVRYAWGSWQVLIALTFGPVLLIGWCLYTRYRIEPILPVSALQSNSAAAACFGALIHGAILMATLCFLSMFHAVSGHNMVLSALCLLPWGLGMVVTSILVGALLSGRGHRWAMWGGWGLVSTSAGLMVLMDNTTPLVASICIVLVGGFGMGTLLISLTQTIQRSTSTDDASIDAETMQMFCGALGRSAGVLAASNLFLNQLQQHMARSPALAMTDFSTHAASVPLQISGMHPMIQSAVVATYTASLHPVWIALSAACGAALVLSICFSRETKPPTMTLPRASELE